MNCRAVSYSIKDFDFKLKSLKKNGVFSGYASVFDVVDRQGDMVTHGAFANAKSERTKLLWQHNASEPIGKILSMTEDARGLFITARLLLNIQKAREAYYLLRGDAIQGLSIGYTTGKYATARGGKVRILKDIQLWEISLVTFPSNAEAVVTDVKSDDEERLLRDMDNIITRLQ